MCLSFTEAKTFSLIGTKAHIIAGSNAKYEAILLLYKSLPSARVVLELCLQALTW
jgi:hypothetical protein